MVYAVRPGKAELLQYELQHLEMIVLLISHDIDMLVKAVFLKPLLCSTEILGDIYGCPVAPEEQLPVESVGSEVAPYRAVSLFFEDAHVQTFLHEGLAEKIGPGLVICPVKGYPEVAVGLVKSLIDPSVHLLPEVYHLLVPMLPSVKHFLGLLEGWCILLGLLL